MSLHAPEIETRDPAEQRERDEAALLSQLASLRERSPFYRDKLAGVEARGLDDLAGAAVHDQGRAARRRSPPSRRSAATSPTPLEQRAARLLDQRHDRRPALHRGHRRRPRRRGRRSARAPTRASGIAAGRRAVLTYNSGPFVAGAVLDAWTRIGATVIPVGSGNTERLVRAFQVLGAEALGCTPSYAIYLADWCRARDIDPREPRAPPARRRGRARRRRAGDARADRGGVRRQRARDDGDRRRLALAVGRVRGAGAACTSAAATSSTPS